MRLKQLLLIVKNSTQKVFVVKYACERKYSEVRWYRFWKSTSILAPSWRRAVLDFFMVFACMAGAPRHFTLLYLHVCARSSQRPEEVIGSLELELEAAVNCWVDSAWTELETLFHLYSFSVSSITTG